MAKFAFLVSGTPGTGWEASPGSGLVFGVRLQHYGLLPGSGERAKNVTVHGLKGGAENLPK